MPHCRYNDFQRFDGKFEANKSVRERLGAIEIVAEAGTRRERDQIRLTGDPQRIRKSRNDCTPFTLTSDPSMEPLDSDTAVAAARSNKLILGTGADHPVTLHVGKFLFDPANEDLLSGLLPSLVHISAEETSLGRIHSLLSMIEQEARQPGPASEFIIVRLVEVILVKILRSRSPGLGTGHLLLSSLADPVISRALSAMDKDVAKGWTVANLAKLCGVSRSTFATRFREIVGVSPIDYLLRWRMVLARDKLRLRSSSIAETGERQ